MKLLIVSLMLALSGCARLEHGDQQPVIVKDENKQIMFTTCSNVAEDWGTCYSKALKTCPNDYLILEKTENANGGYRSLTFQCKNQSFKNESLCLAT